MASWAERRDHEEDARTRERLAAQRRHDRDIAKRDHALALQAAAAAAGSPDSYQLLKQQADELYLDRPADAGSGSESDGAGGAGGAAAGRARGAPRAAETGALRARLRALEKERDDAAREVRELKTELADLAAEHESDDSQRELRALRDAISAGNSAILSRLKELEGTQRGLADKFEFMKNFVGTMIRHMVNMGVIPRDALPPGAAPGGAPGAAPGAAPGGAEGRLPDLRTLMAVAGGTPGN